MALGFLLKGILIGLSIAAPVGPIGVLCIRRTLAEGRWAGLATGLGAATADALYGCLAGFGLAFVTGALMAQRQWLGLAGGVFLCYLGVTTFLAKPAGQPASPQPATLGRAYLSAFLLTLTNPMTILSFVAIFAGLGLANAAHSYLAAGVLVAGVFAGSALWWLLLSVTVGILRRRVTGGGLHWINRLSGLLIVGFGLLALLQAAL
ncbi:MAG: LysE family translocator [Chloroflexota bacterium]